MGDKVTPTTLAAIDSSSTVNQINNNIDLLADEFDNVVYRDGSQDMQGHLNMNSKRILNVAAPQGMTDVLRLQDLADFNSTGTIQTDSNFLQSGTGAVTRTTQGRLRDTVCVKDFGAVGDGVNNDTSAVSLAIAYAVSTGKNVFFPTGLYFLNSNISCPIGPRGFVTLIGEDAMNTRIVFDSSAVNRGFLFDGVSGYSTKGGGLRSLAIYGQNGATRGATFAHCAMPHIAHCTFKDFPGAGIKFEAVLQAKVYHNLVWNCGSPTEGQITVTSGAVAADWSTTLQFDHNYIACGQVGCIAGYMIDRCNTFSIRDGAIESCVVGILIASKTENTVPCDNVTISGVNIENCSPYISIGSGWTGAAGKASSSGNIQFGGFVSTGTPTKGVQLYNTTGYTFFGSKFGLDASAGASYALEGTGNVGVVIIANRSMGGSSWPYVTVNGTQRPDATPYANFSTDETCVIAKSKSISASGTAQTIYAWNAGTSVGEGGICKTLRLTCAAATTISFLRGEYDGCELTIIANDSNGTLKHNAGTFGFILKSGADTPMTAGLPYKFAYNAGTGKWGQI